MSEPPGGAPGESVEGIPEATDPVLTGETVTVDGYLGIVFLGEPERPLGSD